MCCEYVCGDCGLGCALKGVERAAVCLPEGTNPILHSAGDLCHSAFIDHANCFTIFTRSRSFVHVLSSTNNYGVSAGCSGGFVCL